MFRHSGHGYQLSMVWSLAHATDCVNTPAVQGARFNHEQMGERSMYANSIADRRAVVYRDSARESMRARPEQYRLHCRAAGFVTLLALLVSIGDAGAFAAETEPLIPPLPTRLELHESLPPPPPLEFDVDRDTPEQILEILVQHVSELDRAEERKTELLFLYGYCLWRVGQAQEAIEALKAYLEGPAALEAYVDWALGEAYLDVGNVDLAKHYFARARESGRGSHAYDLGTLGEAKVYRIQGEYSRAVDTFKAVDKNHQDRKIACEAKFELAKTLEQKKDYKGAMEAFVEVWAYYPMAPQAEEARTRFEALARKLKVVGPVPPLSARYVRGRSLWLNGWARQGALTLAELAEDPRARRELPDIESEAARLLSIARMYQRALPLYEQIATRTSGEERAGALLSVARTRGRLGDIEGAIASYADIVREYSTDTAAISALRKIGLLRLDQGRYAEAEEAFQQILDREPAARNVEDIEWSLAWTQLRQGKLEAADAHYEAWIGEGTQDSATYYWHARIALAQGDRKSAIEALQIASAPTRPSTYAVFARILLRKLGVPPIEREQGEQTLPKPRLPTDRTSVGLRRAAALYGAGFIEWARDDSWKLHGTVWRLPGVERLGWAVWYQRVGDFKFSTRVASAAFPVSRRGYPRPHDADLRWRLIYPRAYRDRLEGLRWPNGVSEHLVYSVMRQESRFDLWAVSPAGARGPMQLMPDTAIAAARGLGMPDPSVRALHDPRIAVMLGAQVLAKELERYGGNLPLAIAAYNAGEEAVDRWLEERPGLPIDMFIEEISYAETKGYVRHVLENLWVYSLLYGQGVEDFADSIPLDPDMPLPVAPAVGERKPTASSDQQGVTAESAGNRGSGNASEPFVPERS